MKRHGLQLAILVLACMRTALASAAPVAAPAEPASDPPYRFTTDWVSAYERIWTRELARFADKPGVHGLEIGSFEGRSALWFLTNILTGKGSTITCIDPFLAPGSKKRFEHNVRISGLADRVVKIEGYSENELRSLPLAHYDFIYIDGCHRAVCVLTDAVLSWGLLRPGGVLIFDDYGFKAVEGPLWTPKRAIDAFLEIFAPSLRVVHKGYQVIVVKLPLP